MATFPQPFPGTPEEIARNRRTHHINEMTFRCWDCDCRPYGVAAQWPCGASVPRVDGTMDDYRRALGGIE